MTLAETGCQSRLLVARHRLTGSGAAEGTNALWKTACHALRPLGARRVCLHGGWTGADAERALSAKRYSRYQRNALTGGSDSGAPARSQGPTVPIGAKAAQSVARKTGSVSPSV